MSQATDEAMSDQGQSSTREGGGQEPVWTFRGYRLRPSEFTTAMVHFFRAEISRANVWRQRLDTTTNWAVLTTGAAISLAFSEGIAGHRVIMLNMLLITLFLYIEARRYRYYELWSSRVRLMETDFFASMLVPPFHPASDWAESLAENLLHPQFPISMLEAFGRRFRRNYFWIYVILWLAWVSKVWLQPTAAQSWSEFLSRAGMGGLSGAVVLTAGLLFYGALLAIGLLTVGLQRATGEVLPRYEALHWPGLPDLASTVGWPGAKKRRAWFRQSRRRQQLLTFIITDQAQAVSRRILDEMRRGVTGLPGIGMYTGNPHTVLMCALTVTEVAQLKALVAAVDPQAIVILTSAQEVLGTGFLPLKEADSA